MIKIETLLNTRPGEIPKESQFLLDCDHWKLAQSNIHDKAYWVVTMEAGIILNRAKNAAAGARLRRFHNKH